MLDEDLKKAMSADTSRAGTINTKTEDRYLIEREGQPLGMIVSEPHGFVIYACAKQIWPLDRQAFQSLEDAEKQVQRCDRGAR